MLTLVLLLVISPFLAQDQTTDPTASPAATLDPAFVEECLGKLQLVLYHLAEVEAGNEHPTHRLDDAINNYENFGCTWDMFNPTPTPAEAVTTPADTTVATAIPVATTDPAVIPTATVDTTFADVCRSKLELVQHHQAEVNAGNEGPTHRLDDAINNFLGYGCTWDMFNATPTPAEAVTTPADTSVATAIPVATTDPAVIPTATVDTTFVDVCRSKLELVQHHQAEVNAGNESPNDHLDDAINNFLGYGCTWDMFG